MNLFNNIKKVKYTRNQQEVVALKEYIIFDDEKLKEKYVVLKLVNNLNQRLYDIQVEISQYDEYNELVEKSIVSYNTKVEENDEFVPKAKLKVNYLCKTISYKLIYARFERLRYEHGEFFEIAHKFEEHHATLPPVKQAPIVEVVNKKSKKEKKQKYRMRENYKKNIAKFPKFFNALVIIASIAFVVISLIQFRLNARYFSINDVDYYIINEEELAIIGYDSMETDFLVPASIDNRKVTRIMKNSFKNSKVEKVTIRNEGFVIESNSFVNCSALNEVYISSKTTILQNSFVNCDNLQRVYMPKSNLLESTFVGINNLHSLTYKTSDLPSLVEAFDVAEDEEVFIDTLSTEMTYLPVGFLKQAHITNLDISEDCKVGYGNYSHVSKKGYVDNGTVETVNGEVVAINAEDKKLVIDSRVLALDYAKFEEELNQIETLVIESYSDVLNNQLYINLPNLKVFETFDLDSYGYSILNLCNEIHTLITPIPLQNLSSYIGHRPNIINLELKGYGYLSNSMTNNLPFLQNIKISNDLTYWAASLFAQSYNVRSIEVPLNQAYMPFINTFPTMYSIENIVLTPSDRIIGKGYFDGLNNIKSIEIKDGFDYIEGQLISNAPVLHTVILPENMSYESLPLIGENCVSLSNVEYSANYFAHQYSKFNASSDYTKHLKVTQLPYVQEGYLKGVEHLSSLHVEGESINYSGLLQNQRNLESLYLKADHVSSYFSDIFFATSELSNNSKVPSTLNTVIIDTNIIPESYFEKIRGIENIYLQQVTFVEKDAFKETTGLKMVYIPKTLKAEKSLLTDLSDAGVKVLFESEKEVKYNGEKETGVLFEDLYESL